jgi:enterochelin esterase-like enzyme
MEKDKPSINAALNCSILNFSLPEKVMSVNFSRVLGQEQREKRPVIKYVARPRTYEFLANGDVEFNVFAPDAQSVQVGGRPGTTWGTARHDLAAAGDGWWCGVVSGIPAGFQYMDFYFDGTVAIYGHAPIGYGYAQAINFIDVPETGVDFYDLKDVPHGAVRYETYASQVTGRIRNCWVYTPPSYDSSPDRAYPVWYLQHGGGENETGWFWQGKINYILDNLIAAGQCEEMLVVCNSGLAFSQDSAEEIFLPGDLSAVLIRDCIPFIEKRFRAKLQKAGRAMAGLSMGSFQTEAAAFMNPDVFDYIGIFSGAVIAKLEGSIDVSPCFADVDRFNSQHRLLFYSKGMAEGGQAMLDELAALKASGIRLEAFTCPGVHEWQVWRKSAFEFARKLFKTTQS